MKCKKDGGEGELAQCQSPLIDLLIKYERAGSKIELIWYHERKYNEFILYNEGEIVNNNLVDKCMITIHEDKVHKMKNIYYDLIITN